MLERADIFPNKENSQGNIVRKESHGGLKVASYQKLRPIYEEAFGKCDDAVLAWCRDLFIVRRRSGNILQANVQMVVTSNEASQYGAAYVKARTEAPAIAVERSNEEYDPTRFLNPNIAFRKQYENPDQNTKVLLSGKEIPYNIQYTLGLWTKSQEDMNYLKAEILKRLNPIDQVYIEGNRVDVKYISSIDNSDLEPGEGEEKIVKYDIIIELESGLNPDQVESPTVNEVVLNYDTLESFESICENK